MSLWLVVASIGEKFSVGGERRTLARLVERNRCVDAQRRAQAFVEGIVHAEQHIDTEAGVFFQRVEFDSPEAARTFYFSDVYQAVLPFRLNASGRRGFACLLTGAR